MAQNEPEAGHQRASSRRVGALGALFPFFAPYRRYVVLAACALVLTASVSLLLPIAARRVVDGFESGVVALLDGYFIAAIGIAAVFALGTGARYYIVTRLGERVVADIRKALFARMIGMSPAYFESLLTGEVISRITTDTTLILSVIGSSVSWFLRNMLMFLGGLAMMLFTSGKLTLMVLAIIPVVIVPILALGRRLRALSRENQDWIAQSSGAAAEALQAAQTVQAYSHEAATRERFGEVTEQSYRSAKVRVGVRALLTIIIIFVVFTGILGVLWIGARDVRAGAMTAGELVQFLIYAGIMAGSVAALSEIWGELQRAAGATERLIELLKATDTVSDPRTPRALPKPVRGEITFEDVVFHYPTRPEDAALNGVSFTARPGEQIALVGPSGAGKSTILQLLLRFYDPQSGTVRLDGVALPEMERAAFRRNLAVVPQDAVIFADTVRENIRFGRPEASNAEVEAAATAAQAHDFILAMLNGYDTYVGERGVMLSGGQKQRIAIARAILRDAPVLLLDEATSALDAASERAVQEAVAAMTEGRTTLIVAHRLATVKQADRILVFDGGQIVAEGTHAELVAQDGLYARLARLQFTEGSAAA